ncbi:ADP-ribosylglycohydrolase family protein [Yoonia sp. 208BN28-4]|uniref:ADP-ribosylglycohydrolase family protein n=1 Tax=Yoonia sp. 208BN28-4 TaxID=3126505 RepID=UPI0030ABE6F5
MSTAANMVLGALVADAASLGVHWIYEPERLTQIADRQDGRTAFTTPDAENYADVMGYFAHAARENGMLTQYGEALLLAVRSINAQDSYDTDAHAEAFAAHFGAGGTYSGYIDRPTRGALANIADEKTPSGIDDDQLPATATLPAIMARYGSTDQMDDMRQAAMQVTNVNGVAEAYSAIFADVLGRVLSGAPVSEALRDVAKGATGEVGDALTDALDTQTANSIFYGETTGRACHLPMGGPLAFHILHRAETFADAIERNNRAGGDSAGRAILIGAVMAAAHGVASPKGIPLAWVLSLHDARGIWDDCTALAP